jgi:hypothetical protein
MDNALQIALLFDGITAVLGLIFLTAIWFLCQASYSCWKMTKDGQTLSMGQAIERENLIKRIFVRVVTVLVAFSIMLLWMNRETAWFRPEPAPVVNPERAEKVDEIMNREIVVNDPVNVPERQKMDPEDLAVKDNVEQMDDLAGGPENR